MKNKKYSTTDNFLNVSNEEKQINFIYQLNYFEAIDKNWEREPKIKNIVFYVFGEILFYLSFFFENYFFSFLSIFYFFAFFFIFLIFKLNIIKNSFLKYGSKKREK